MILPRFPNSCPSPAKNSDRFLILAVTEGNPVQGTWRKRTPSATPFRLSSPKTMRVRSREGRAPRKSRPSLWGNHLIHHHRFRPKTILHPLNQSRNAVELHQWFPCLVILLEPLSACQSKMLRLTTSSHLPLFPVNRQTQRSKKRDRIQHFPFRSRKMSGNLIQSMRKRLALLLLCLKSQSHLKVWSGKSVSRTSQVPHLGILLTRFP